MQQFENRGENLPEQVDADNDYNQALKKSHRRGMLKGAILMLVICVLVVFVGGGYFISSLTKTKVGVTVAENGEKHNAIFTYDSLIGLKEIQKINSLAAAIQTYYYEEVDPDLLLEGMYAGLYDSLDVYSEYYSAEEYNELYNMDIVGNYCGIGATLSQSTITMMVEVISVQKDSPAELAGIKPGDMIISADEYDAATMSLDEFVTHVRGEEGTTVNIEIYRPDKEEYLTFEVVRADLEIQSIAYDMLNETVGYIQISQFLDNTDEQFGNALADLKTQGMTKLIVDVRNNGGGLVSSVSAITDMILEDGLIVYMEDKYGNRQEAVANAKESLDLPMVVLINGNSASASEIFAGAMKDHGKGTLVGTQTFGKGIVQDMKQLRDGSAFKLTTSTYYTPSGACIHGVGIEPDVVLEYEFLGGEEDAYAYEYDNQLQKALEILR